MNLWDLYDEGAWAVIPTNTTIKTNGEAVMGAGLALQAAQRFPTLPRLYGNRLRYDLVRTTFTEWRLVMLPTKLDWQKPSTLKLIEDSCAWLRGWANGRDAETIAVPRLGCGAGGLAKGDVAPFLKTLPSPPFILV